MTAPAERRLPHVGHAALLLAILVLALLCGSPVASGAPLGDDGGAEWRVEQPLPPPPEQAGVARGETRVSMGHIGDIEFWEPNRGALITDGNGGSIGAGVWLYDGTGWRELSNECGGTDGRIAWAGPDEFWTVSDGRAGAAVASSSELPPLEDNTLCHFAPGPAGDMEIVASYASLPFKGDSYQAMHAAACLSPSNCWFGGAPLPAPQVGAFQLHWNGVSVEPDPYLPEARQIFEMGAFEDHVFESLRLLSTDAGKQSLRPPPLRKIKASFAGEESPFEPLEDPREFELPEGEPLLYSQAEHSFALDYLHLSSADNDLWAGAGPQVPPEGGREAGITIVRKEAEGPWSTVVGPAAGENESEPPPGAKLFPAGTLTALAAEPGASAAWLGLVPLSEAIFEGAHAPAVVARVSSTGAVSDRLEVPSEGEAEGQHYGPLGATIRVVCPALHDCWAATSHGWLLHLAPTGERQITQLNDPAFSRIQSEEPITFRPADEGVPQEPVDAVPNETNGEAEFNPVQTVIKAPPVEAPKVKVPLLTHVKSRIAHRTTLVLSFHLAVKARVALTAYRKNTVVARTGNRTLKAGNRSVQVKLNPKRWPTRLHLATTALAPLPEQATTSPTVNSVSTGFVAPARLLSEGLGF
jgi:hypothetical protein